MAVESGKTQLGAPLPDLVLRDVDGAEVALQDLQGGGPLVIVFSANHCPYVRHVEGLLGSMADDLSPAGVAFVAIASNDVDTYPDDDAPGMREQAARAGWNFPYLVDDDQHSAAHAFGAVCTPDFFVYGADRRLAYRGAFDASTPKNGEPLTGDLLRGAIDATLRGESVPEPQRPAMGCGIKWRPGHEPEAVSFS